MPPPFPISPVLDDFNAGASQNLTARTGWNASVMITGDASWVTDGTPTTATGNGAASNVWDGPSSRDMEAWATMGTFTPPSMEFYICVRITVTGAAFTMYCLHLATPGDGLAFRIVKFVAGAGTNLGAAPSTTVVAGDSVGVTVIKNTITTWFKAAAGSWGAVEAVVDSSITDAGKIGIISRGVTGLAIDKFAGGPLPLQLSSAGAGQ